MEPELDLERLAASSYLAAVEHHASIDSTQQRAHDLAAAGTARMPCLVIAEQQTAGRGRGTNAWWTGQGSLAFSLLFDPATWGIGPALLPARSLAAAVAIADAVAPVLEGHRVGLHWPNDVYAGDRKLAGILLDVLPDGRHLLGVGLNVNNSLAAAPPEVRQRATTLFELTGRRHDRTEILLDLLKRIKEMFHLASDAPEFVGQRFEQLCLQCGEQLIVDVGGRRASGRCAGIARDGALLLETSTGYQRIYSGILRASDQ